MDANTTKRIAAEQDDDLVLHEEDSEDEDMSEEDLEGFLVGAIGRGCGAKTSGCS